MLLVSRSQAELNNEVLETPTQFVTATNSSCRQAASLAMPKLILN
jgi:hypothetical protein